MDIDAPARAEGGAPLENGFLAGASFITRVNSAALFALAFCPRFQDEIVIEVSFGEQQWCVGAGHAEEAAQDGLAAAEPCQGDALLQEASAAAGAPAEAAGQLPAAPAQPTAPSAVDAPARATAAAAANPQVDATAATGALAQATHPISAEEAPEPYAAAAGASLPHAAAAIPSAQHGPGQGMFSAAVSQQQPAHAIGVHYQAFTQAVGPSDQALAGSVRAANAAVSAAEAAAAAEVAQMVDSMINVPEADRAPAAAVEHAQQPVGLNKSGLQTAQPVAQEAAMLDASAQTGVPRISSQRSVPVSVPGYMGPAASQPLQSTVIPTAEVCSQHAPCDGFWTSGSTMSSECLSRAFLYRLCAARHVATCDNASDRRVRQELYGPF